MCVFAFFGLDQLLEFLIQDRLFRLQRPYFRLQIRYNQGGRLILNPEGNIILENEWHGFTSAVIIVSVEISQVQVLSN